MRRRDFLGTLWAAALAGGTSREKFKQLQEDNRDFASSHQPHYFEWSVYGSHCLTLHSLADGSIRQGQKANLRKRYEHKLYSLLVCTAFDVPPIACEMLEIYWAASHYRALGAGNMRGVYGVDCGVEESVIPQLIFLGGHVVAATTDVQISMIGVCRPPSQYGSIVVRNNSGQMLSSDPTVHKVIMIPRDIETPSVRSNEE